MLTAAPAPLHDSCATSAGGSVAAAAASQSALAGVLAGFLFGGIVVVLSVRTARHSSEAANALKLQFSAFVGLAVAAYLLSDQAGDELCLRATSEKAVTDGIFSTFAVVAVVSLTWLIVAYERHTHGILRFLRGLAYVATAFVVLLKCTSTYTCLQAELPHGPPAAVSALIAAAGVLLYLAAVAAGPRPPRPAAARIPRQAGHGPPPGAPGGRERRDRARTDRCAWLALGYPAAAAVGDAVVQSFSGRARSRPEVPAAYAVAWTSLLLPLGVLVAAPGALAPEPADGDRAGPRKETGTAAGVPLQAPPRQARRPGARR